MHLEQYIRNIPDYPKPGIQFKDVTSLLAHADAFKYSINALVKHCSPRSPNKIVGIESRGFIIGSAMAYAMNLPFIPIRKKGKLPAETISVEYELEYASDSLEIHKDSLDKNDKLVIVDDLLATGGTVFAAIDLCQQLDAEILELAFLIDLPELGGSKKLGDNGYPCFSLMKFGGL